MRIRQNFSIYLCICTREITACVCTDNVRAFRKLGVLSIGWATRQQLDFSPTVPARGARAIW